MTYGISAAEATLAWLNLARAHPCLECLTIRGRFAYWLHRRSNKHRPLTMREYMEAVKG